MSWQQVEGTKDVCAGRRLRGKVQSKVAVVARAWEPTPMFRAAPEQSISDAAREYNPTPIRPMRANQKAAVTQIAYAEGWRAGLVPFSTISTAIGRRWLRVCDSPALRDTYVLQDSVSGVTQDGRASYGDMQGSQIQKALGRTKAVLCGMKPLIINCPTGNAQRAQHQPSATTEGSRWAGMGGGMTSTTAQTHKPASRGQGMERQCWGPPVVYFS